MNANDILDMIGDVKDTYVLDAMQCRNGMMISKKRSPSAGRIWLMAAAAVLMLLLAGCAVACMNGWFVDFFSAGNKTALSDGQVKYIQEKEQIIQQTQTMDGWTVELKSTFCAGNTAYAIFTVTAPEGIDLEEANIETPDDDDSIIPGNSGMTFEGRHMLDFSAKEAGQERNIVWNHSTGWKADNDGRPNTLNYVISIQTEIPFDAGMEFDICFDNFVHAWEDPEIRKAIDEKYAGQDYMIDGEEMKGLHKSEILVEEEWEFTIAFAGENRMDEKLELVSDYVMTWAQVIWKLDDEPVAYRTGNGIAAVKITSFVLDPMGATIQYAFEEPMFGAFIEYQDHFGFEDRYVYAVMKDGSRIALHTHGTGDRLTAESPVILSELDHVLLGDGGKLTASGEWIQPEF